MLKIRRACDEDIPEVIRLLEEVLEIHARIRPDIFIPGTTKYSPEQLKEIFRNEDTPVFAAADENDHIKGYIFCSLQRPGHPENMKDLLTLYIDDLCVDESARGMHVGRQLFEYAKEYARKRGCHNITLNVWEGNDSAKAFYEKVGFGVQKTHMEYILD